MISNNSYTIRFNGEISSKIKQRFVEKNDVSDDEAALGVIQIYLEMGFDLATAVALLSIDITGNFSLVVSNGVERVGMARGIDLYLFKHSPVQQWLSQELIDMYNFMNVPTERYSLIYKLQDTDLVSIGPDELTKFEICEKESRSDLLKLGTITWTTTH